MGQTPPGKGGLVLQSSAQGAGVRRGGREGRVHNGIDGGRKKEVRFVEKPGRKGEKNHGLWAQRCWGGSCERFCYFGFGKECTFEHEPVCVGWVRISS